jgi:hypothetical protein
LFEISKVWKDINDVDQAALLEIIAGKNRSNTAAAILSNTKDLEKAFEAAQSAEGSALRENEKYLDSIQGRIDQFNNAVQTMWSNSLDSDFIKDIVSLGTEFIKLVDKIGLVNSALIAIATISMVKNKTGPIAFFKGLIEAGTQGITKIGKYTKGLKDVTFQTNALYKAKTELTQAQLKEKLTSTGLTDSAAEEIVAKTKLGKATDELSASTLDATLREAGYGKEKREAIIQSVFDTQATDDNTQANKENAASNVVAGAAEDKETQDTKENMIATQQDTAAIRDNTQANKENAASNVTLSQKIKNLGSSVGSFVKQNAATFIALGTTLLTIGLTKLVDALVETMDEANEEFSDATNKLNSLNSELENLESQLEDINGQIAELTAKTPLSFTDQEELSRLQAQSAELQRQIDLTETLKKQASIKANSEAMHAAEKYENANVKTGKTTSESVGNTVKAVGGTGLAATGLFASGLAASIITAGGAIGATNFWNPVGWVALAAAAVTAIAAGVTAAVVASEGKVGDSIDNMKERYTKLQEEYNTARTKYTNDPTKKNKKKYDEAQEALNDYKASMSEYMTEMDAYYQTIRNNWDTATEDQKKAAIEWADQMDAYAIASGGQNAKGNAINQVFTDGALMGKFKKEKAEIDGYVEALKNGDESAAQSIADLINNNQALKDAFSAKTLNPQDAIDYFVKIGEAANFATIEGKTEEIRKATEKLGYAFQNVGKFMDGDKVDTVAIAEYFKGTSEATRTEIARLVKNIHDGEITVQQAMKSFAAYGMAESWKIIEAEVAELNTEVFKDIGDEIYGVINTVKELSAAFDDVAKSIDLVSQAEAEMAYSGHLSVETALQLMESTDDWNQVLEIENGNIKLLDGAEEALVQTKLDLIKTNIQTALSTVEAQLAQLDATTANIDAATTIEESTNVAVRNLAGNMAYAAKMAEAYTRAMAGEKINIQSFIDEAKAAQQDVLDQTNYQKNASTAVGREELEKEKARLEAMIGMYETVDTASEFKKNYSSDKVSGGNATKEDANNSLFQREMEYWENRIAANQAKYEQVQNEVDLLEAKGQRAGEVYYKKQIELENERKSLLEQQKDEAYEYLDTLKEGSEEWWDVANTINDIEGELDDVIANVHELNEAIGQIHWDTLEEVNNRYSNLTSDLQSIRDILAAEDMFDETGDWTEAGVASLATHIQERAINQQALDETNTELSRFDRDYIGNEKYYEDLGLGIDSEQDYYDKLRELTEQQHEYRKAVLDSNESVVEMYEQQIDAIEEYTSSLVDHYNDYIDSVQEALDAERDLYEFKKDVEKQTKDIASLERRIASLSGSSAAADIAERRKLEAQLQEAREGLDDTYYSHAKDAQSKALDDEAKAYEETMNRYIDGLRTALEQATEDMTTFVDTIASNVAANADVVYDEYTKTGLALDETLTQPWVDAAAKLGEFGVSLDAMNDWTADGGVFDIFQTKASEKLTLPWTNGQTAIANFNTSVEKGMKKVYSDVTSNVKDSIEQLNKLNVEIGKINDTTIKPASSDTTSKTPKQPAKTDNTSKTISGEHVKQLQKFLNTGFGAGLTVDGLYGPATKAAVIAAQNKARGALGNFVAVNGKYDSDTRNAFTAYWNDRATKDRSQREWWEKNWKGKLPTPMYAKGTMGTSRDSFAITDESWIGEEITLAAGKNGQLQYLKKGSAVLPSDIAENLVEWGKINPNMMSAPNAGVNINMISNAVNKPEFNLAFDALVKADRIDENTLPEVKKFVQQEINNLVKQMNYSLKRSGAR